MQKLIEGKDYTIVDGVLTVNEGVKHIPEFQFSDSENIRKVVFPYTLISIGLNAFSNCCNLIDVNFSNSIEYIHSFAFRGCALSSITLGKNLYYIGYEAFSHNDLFEVINNSTKLRMISPYAFGDNKNLMRFNMNSDAYVFSNVFSGSNHEEKLMNNSRFINYRDCNVCSYKDNDKYKYDNGVLIIKDGVEIIKDFSVFTDCVSVEMPDSVILIDSDAFKGLKKLEHVKFSENLFYIFYSTFQSCSLRTHELILPEKLCEIKEYAFASNLGENKIIVSNNTGYMRNTIPNISDPFEFREYDEIIYKKKYSLNISELLKEDKELLKSLSLMPDNINLNKTLNNKLDKTQSNILKEALINFLSYINYDEEDDPIDEVMKKYALEVVRISAFSYSGIQYVKNQFQNLEGFGRIDGSIGITLMYLVSSELNDDLLEMTFE